MSKENSIPENVIKYFCYVMCFITVLLFVMAFFKTDDTGEASRGKFTSYSFDEGWTCEVNGETNSVTLPVTLDCPKNTKVTLKNILPEYIAGEMTIMFRTYMEDIFVYIDGEPRTSYYTDGFQYMNYYLPSSYVAIPLTEKDGGKNIEVQITVKAKGVLNSVSLSYGNNGWYPIILDNLALAVSATLVLCFGVLLLLFYIFFHNKMNISKAMIYLGLLMMMLGIWVLSESKLRQFIFVHPSYSNYFSYISIEVLGALVAFYFDEVQGRRYHKTYMGITGLITIQITANLILHFAHIKEFHDTLMLSHIFSAIGLTLVVFDIIMDIKKKVVSTYKFIAVGMAFFTVFCIGELASYYIKIFETFGVFLCIGLLILMFTTIIQIVSDEIERIKARERANQKSWISTIETIASAIDAKDEYTGGHSNRVAEYAGILAHEMAPKYHFKDRDILRIRYIGLMHDIGKIGVADSILNKVGKLSDEEFTLMKKHAEIGYDLLLAKDATMKDLLDGVKYHHERYDGKGYPEGLEGEGIPLIARILCLADSYDAMTSNRVYRKRLSDEDVKNEIIRCAGTQFDPDLARIFVEAIDRGVLKPITVEGLDVTDDGNIRLSSLLEAKLQKDLHKDTKTILHASHIRMVCYIIKLAEKRRRALNIYLLDMNGLKRNDADEDFSAQVRPFLRARDICIPYETNTHLVVLFDRNSDEVEKFCSSLSKEIMITEIK